MTMTRAGYELIAEAMHHAKKQAKARVMRETDSAADGDCIELWAVDVAIEEVVQELCTALKIDNRHFDKQRFNDFINNLDKKGKK